jgi:hypothetical protein
MKPFYTIDAGEFLVGSRIEKELPGVSLWFPAKDEGDDILLLDRKQGTYCTVQIKVSRDYLATHMHESYHPYLTCCGWFTPQRKKIKESPSDFWLICLHSYGKHRLSILIIQPKELLQRYDKIHGKKERLQSYFWVTKDRKVFEARGLSKNEKQDLKSGIFNDPKRDFTQFLENWGALKAKLSLKQL